MKISQAGGPFKTNVLTVDGKVVGKIKFVHSGSYLLTVYGYQFDGLSLHGKTMKKNCKAFTTRTAAKKEARKIFLNSGI